MNIRAVWLVVDSQGIRLPRETKKRGAAQAGQPLFTFWA